MRCVVLKFVISVCICSNTCYLHIGHNWLVCIQKFREIYASALIDCIYRSWYAYVIELCINVVSSGVETFFLLVFYHIFLTFLIWAYYKTIFTPSAPVPNQFKISRVEMEQLVKIKNPDEQTRYLKHLAVDLPLVCRILSSKLS